MKKLKIYLDTSVISHLDQQDAPERMAETKMLWEEIKAGVYDVFISPVVVTEIERCHEPKLSILRERLQSIQYTLLQETDEVLMLADRYLDTNILRKKSFDDCQHIAYACVFNCDMILSWNFKHLVNHKTISGVKSVNALAGYREMLIYTPTMLISGGEKDDT
jgi:predicted nucleic acid-binding protein